MEHYTIKQHILIVKHYYRNCANLIATIRKVYLIFSQQNVPNLSTVKRIIKKFERTVSVSGVKPRHEHVSYSEQNIKGS